MSVVQDVAAERAVLAGICQHGGDLFLDITDLVKVNTFAVDSNKVIFKCLEHICKEDGAVIDLPSILSAAKELQLDHILERKEEAKHLSSILALKTAPQNVRRFAGKLRRLEIARLIHDQGALLQEKMSEIDGTEAVSELLGIAENTIFDFTSMFDGESELKPTQVGDGIEEYVKYLEDNPCQQIGISTGFPQFDESIGGGLNPGVAMIGARPKVGKTTLSINVAYNIAKSGVPVLYVDTEMIEKGRYRDISDKLLASISGQDIKDIKTGAFSDSPAAKANVHDAAEQIAKSPLYRIDIAGKPFEDQLYVIRRWVQSTVGLNPDGTAKECVIIYDYLKMMDMEGVNDAVREFQMLGMMMTALQNFGTRYAVPILAFTQLNRDGIDNETSAVVSGSDRLTWFCTSFSILKHKSEEEIAEDGPELGNRKMVTVLSRYGPGHDFGEYVNAQMNKYKAQLIEIDPALLNNIGDNFVVVEDDNDDQIPFE